MVLYVTRNIKKKFTKIAKIDLKWQILKKN